MAETARKAVRTRKQRQTGKRVAERRQWLMLETKDLLREWQRKTEGKDICAVCGDGVPGTILQKHHLNPNVKSQGTVLLCASCHNIFNKAKQTTTVSNVVRDLKLRHEKFDYNIKQSQNSMDR